MKKSFTLLELLVVIIIVGVLGTLGITNYMAAKEKALDKEAISNLKLIQSAEKIYQMETDTYYPDTPPDPQTDIAEINDNLKLSLKADVNRNWNYSVNGLGCGQATRNGGDARSFFLTIGDVDGEPNSGTCP